MYRCISILPMFGLLMGFSSALLHSGESFTQSKSNSYLEPINVIYRLKVSFAASRKYEASRGLSATTELLVKYGNMIWTSP